MESASSITHPAGSPTEIYMYTLVHCQLASLPALMYAFRSFLHDSHCAATIDIRKERTV